MSSSSSSSKPKSSSSSGWLSTAVLPGILAAAAAVFYASPWQSLLSGEPSLTPSSNVTIRQGTVLGRLVDDGTYPEPVEGFMGIPYALPPTYDLRFKEAVPVPEGNGTQEAFYLGPRCPGKQLVPFPTDDGLGPDIESEDCLYINVWRKQLTPKEKEQQQQGKQKLLPVAVLIPGGAFNRGAARMHNTHGMLAHSAEPWIAVSMQYRIGVFGGLNTELTAQQGLLNLGLKDMYVALEWIQDNIAAFGGDPDDVTIMGLSAAAHGIGHLIMDVKTHQQEKKLFHKAIMDSGAHTARAIHPPDSKLNTQHFRELLHLIPSCAAYVNDLLHPDILPCLRALPSEEIDKAGKTVFAASNPSVRWAWQPVFDNQIISRHPAVSAWKSGGHWRKVPILTGSAHNEGSYYVPLSSNSSSDLRDFFHTLLPHLTSADLEELEKLYPDPLTYPETSPYVERSGDPKVGSQFRRLEAAYGHYAYTCPVRQTAMYASSVADKKNPPPAVFLYHWALNKTALFGANHGDQTRYQTYNAEVRAISPAQDEVAARFHAYCTSFIVKGDPNGLRDGDGRRGVADRPSWPGWEEGKGLTMVLGEGNDERAGGQGKGTSAKVEDYRWAEEECKFWWRVSETWED